MRAPIVALLLLAAASLSAHELGTTQVVARMHGGGTYTIDVTTAPRPLVGKLERRAALAPSNAPDLRARLAALAPVIAAAAEVRFDGVRVTPAVDVLPLAANGPDAVTIRLTGAIPPRGGDFTWRWPLTYASYNLSVANDGRGAARSEWLDGDTPSAPFPLAREVATPSRREVARQYLALGFTHIVPYGLDHILFVLGLFLLAARAKDVLAQVTAFTVAHSITLGLTIYGVVSLPSRVVEPLIAVSIAWIAVENLCTTVVRRSRVAVVFAFGLLHGMGFAGVLRELGLPRERFLTALVTFNAGVELGQLAVIGAAFLGVALWHRQKPWYRGRVVVPASVAIAATGLFWTVQRIIA